MIEIYKQYYERLKINGKFRTLPEKIPNNILDFSSNDYLGLSQSSSLLEAAELAGKEFGIGSTGSRLLSGNQKIFEAFENTIARDKKSESALIVNSGFQANLTVLACLLDKSILKQKPLVFFDKLNHASLYQAIVLSGAELIRYQHNDMNHLQELLEKFKHETRFKFIVTETLFGMDGDMVSLDEIVMLAEQHRAFLFLDEAHTTGVFGKEGYGISPDINLKNIPHVVMGTFSKALGCYGAYIACSNIIKNYLVNKCYGFIYTTSLSPMIVGAAAAAWDLVKDMAGNRQELQSKARNLRNKLQELGFNTLHSVSHIIPIILHDEIDVIQAKNFLLTQGILVSAVRPPTVPIGTSRLRIALTVNHSEQDLDHLLNALSQL